MNILLADDDRNFGSILKRELEDEGYDVDLVTDGVEAVLRFMDNSYDFILLDIKMPKLDGINALRIMKRVRSETPAITISGNAGSGEMAESVRAGAIRCFTKPFEIQQLKSDIRRYVGR
ncbi:MAG: response regulator [Nitrospirae bacterium]|nr:response regulator [Nitrospirota bacterium]